MVIPVSIVYQLVVMSAQYRAPLTCVMGSLQQLAISELHCIPALIPVSLLIPGMAASGCREAISSSLWVFWINQ